MEPLSRCQLDILQAAEGHVMLGCACRRVAKRTENASSSPLRMTCTMLREAHKPRQRLLQALPHVWPVHCCCAHCWELERRCSFCVNC